MMMSAEWRYWILWQIRLMLHHATIRYVRECDVMLQYLQTNIINSRIQINTVLGWRRYKNYIYSTFCILKIENKKVLQNCIKYIMLILQILGNPLWNVVCILDKYFTGQSLSKYFISTNNLHKIWCMFSNGSSDTKWVVKINQDVWTQAVLERVV